MALPGEECRVRPPSEWTKPEKWAWTKICQGQNADFNELLNEKTDPGNSDPGNSDCDCKWSDDRKLSSRFLETILLHEPFRSAVPYHGVRIVGAYFPDCINLRGAVLERQLMLYGSYFDSKVDMTFLKTSTFLALTGSKFDSELVMNTISVDSSLYLESAEFKKDVHLGGAKIRYRVSMNGAKFRGRLSMHSTSVGLNLAMLKGAEFDEPVDLSFLSVGSEIEMNRAKFKRKLSMRSASVNLNLAMPGAKFDELVDLSFLSVGANLDARGATLRRLDLTGARIEGELQLGSPAEKKIDWKECKDENEPCQAPKLVLRNTSVSTLQDTKDTWPDHLKREFEGSIYDRLGGLGASEQDDPYEQGSCWFIEWLAKDESYSPQPYRHLAGVLRTAGYEGMAVDILVANRDREREETNWWPLKWLWLWALKLVIGYGYGLRCFYALGWATLFVVAGTAFMRQAKGTGIEGTPGWSYCFFYSLDKLLPLIRLREQHYTGVDIINGVKYYFYVHQIVGYGLISFVLAGLSGLVE